MVVAISDWYRYFGQCISLFSQFDMTLKLDIGTNNDLLMYSQNNKNDIAYFKTIKTSYFHCSESRLAICSHHPFMF